jgi:ATP-dependent DNA helicase RecG
MTTVRVEQALRKSPPEVGNALLGLKEDQWFERKSARIAARDLANHLIGMANADGGIIIVGLHNGVIEGTDNSPDRRNAQMQAHVDFVAPPLRAKSSLIPCVAPHGLDHLLRIDVPTSDQVHASTKDEVYLRVGDETRRLTFQQRQELLFDKGQASYEARAVPGTGFDLLDEELLASYASSLRHPDPHRLMVARGLATREGELTVAGVLLFAEAPQALLPETFVRVLRYRGTERGAGASQQLIHDARFEGPIPDQLMRARDDIKEQQLVRRALLPSGVFGDVPLIPEDAWLEGLVNAVVHRSYSLAGDHIRVEIFSDRMEISSPGRFPGLVSLSDPIRATRFARNPRIARVAADLHFGQELGEGIRRIYVEMRQAGLMDPVYRQTSASVQLTLSAEPADRALEELLPPQAREITSALREAVRLSTGEIAEMLGLSRPVVLSRLNALRDLRLIEWVGKSPRDPRAYWTLPAPERTSNDDSPGT